VLTRIVFTIPSLVVGGSLLMEKHFGVPGIGRVTYTAVSTGDQSVLLVVVSLTAIVFVVLNQSIDYLYEKIDPRIRSASSP
jgi:peptide/nickel transport system permease protein